MSAPKTPIATYLEWCDAVSNPNWFTRDELERWAASTEWVIKQCGWVVKETTEYILFAGAWKPEDANTDEKFSNLHLIPKTWIRKRKALKT